MAYALLEEANMLSLLAVLRAVNEDYREGVNIHATSIVSNPHKGLQAAARLVWPHATLSSSSTLLCEVSSVY